MNKPQKTHILKVRIYFEDTDAGGIVYHSRYLNYCERARAEMLREVGIESAAMIHEHHCGFAVRRAELDFKAPAHLDDELALETRIVEMKGASAIAEHVISRGDTELVRVNIVLVCLGAGERAVRIPEAVREAIKVWV